MDGSGLFCYVAVINHLSKATLNVPKHIGEISRRCNDEKKSAWRKYLTERLSMNREETVHFLDGVMEEFQIYENFATVLSALEVVIEAQGGVSELAKRTHMSPDALLKILSSDKAPHVDTLGTMLNALGCRLSIVPLETDIAYSDTDAE